MIYQVLKIINVPDEKDALLACMENYRDGKADIVMKGKISTGKMMQTALKKRIWIKDKAHIKSCCFF